MHALAQSTSWQEQITSVEPVTSLATGGVPAAGGTFEQVGGATPGTVDAAATAVALLVARYTSATSVVIAATTTDPDLVDVFTLAIDPAAAPEAAIRATAQARAAAYRVGIAELVAARQAGPGTPACHAVLVSAECAAAEQDGTVLAELAVRIGPSRATLAVRGGTVAAEYARALGRHFGNLLGGLTAPVVAQVDDLPVLEAAEQRMILHEWNADRLELPVWSVPQRIAEIAASDPDRAAVQDETETLTYGELVERAARLAGHLVRSGVAAGDHVAVLLERGVANIVAQLAVFRAGGCVVLADADYPPEQLRRMIEVSGAVRVLTRSGFAEVTGTVPTVLMDASPAPWADAGPITEQPTADDDEHSHIAFTSGSTGEPKAVALCHGPFRNTVAAVIDQCGMDATTRGSWLCSPATGLVEVDFFPVLAAGGTVIVPSVPDTASAGALRDWLVGKGITHTLQLTAMAEQLWSQPWPEQTVLRSMRVAGEQVRTWPAPELPYSVLNVYGSSEANVVATCDLTELLQADPGLRTRGAAVPVGRPLPNVRTYVLDGRQRPVPPGVHGELHISGAGLSAGYLASPEATSSRFITNPIEGDPYPVLYRTGDRARFWPDGTLEIVGRLDDEVKIRGHRVQPAEVEQVLLAQPGVRQAAVVAREDVPGQRRLVAYVEPDAAYGLSVVPLRRALADHLPTFKLPAAYVVTTLPMTKAGKVDRAELPPPPRTRPDVSADWVAARTETETELVGIWEQVLDIEGIGVLDNFIELGGDSLSAMRLLTELRARYRVAFEMSDLYDAPSIAAAARVVERLVAQGATESVSLPVVVEHDAEGRFEPFPLSETQQALWIGRGGAVEYGNVGCHGYFEWERKGLDPDRFRRAWTALLERHDMLRTIVKPDGTQVVLRELPSDGVTIHDHRSLPLFEAREAADATRAFMSHQVMDPASWPLFDVRLSLLPDGTVRLHIGIDLLLMDAWSAFQVLFPDLIELYESPEGELPPVGIGFRDYILAAQRTVPTLPEYERSARYWRSRLASLPAAPDLPMVTTPTGPVLFDRFDHELEPARWARLKELANESGITPSGILVAVFAEVMRGWSRNDRFTINFPIFERLPLHENIDRVLGDFTNTILVAVEKTDGTFQERAKDVQAQLWHDLDHRHFNGVEVLRELTRANGGALRPAMPIVVTSLLGHPPRRQVSALGEETYGISQTPQVLLDFQIREIDAALHFKWDHLAALYPDGMIEAMFNAYCDVLDRLIDDESAWHTDRFDLLPQRDRATQDAANATDGGVRDMVLQQLLAEQAAERPAGEAVVDARRRVTYAELYAEANQLARLLRRNGVGPGDMVGIVTEKGWEGYPAVYGVLSAGAAYLPIDAKVPADRLAHLLQRGGVEVVLTQPWLVDSVSWPDGVRVFAVGKDGLDEDTGPVEIRQTPDDIAYVIYTSGSTGAPKGVAVAHRGVVNMADAVNAQIGNGPHTKGFAVAGLHFDMSIYDVFGLIAAGGTVVLPTPTPAPEPDAWLDLVVAEGINFWSSVPQLLEMAVGPAEARGDAALSSIRTVVLSGDWIGLTLPDRFRAQAPGSVMFSAGGPTETICWSILHRIDEVDQTQASVPYGKPITNQRYHIVDPRGELRPTWAAGEMVVASEVGLAKEYFRDTALTAQRFYRLPSTGERVYATGDIGRYLPDGSIEILGRDDFQVKVQGYRIELGEIESALAKHPAVASAVVVAPGTAVGGRRLVAFVVMADGEHDAGPDEFGEFLREQLPAYLVPADIRVVETLPLTGNGKIDRRALTEAAAAGVVAERSAEATPLEQVVGALCADTLGLAEPLPPSANFFQAGGDSLSGTRFVALLNEAFDLDVALRSVFTLPTIGDLAADLAAHPESGTRTVKFAEALVSLTDDELDKLIEAQSDSD